MLVDWLQSLMLFLTGLHAGAFLGLNLGVDPSLRQLTPAEWVRVRQQIIHYFGDKIPFYLVPVLDSIRTWIGVLGFLLLVFAVVV